MLKQRVITGLIGLPLLLGALIWGPKLGVCLFFMGCAALGVFEMASMLFPALDRSICRGGAEQGQLALTNKRWVMFCVAAAALMYGSATLNLTGAKLGGIIFVLLLAMVAGAFAAASIERSIVNITASVVSLCYGALPWLCIWDLYLMGEHARFILLMLTIVMMGDTGAYFAGMSWGRTKLAPRLSPKKTWEGAIAGLIASMVGAVLINAAFGLSLGPMWLMVLLACLAGLAGIMGDLVESTFKRFAGVKDSGHIFPGHGGFLDRADSVLFAAPTVWMVVYVYQNFGL